MLEVFLLVQKKRNNKPILYHLDQLWQNKLQKLFHGSMLMSQQLCKPMIKAKLYIISPINTWLMFWHTEWGLVLSKMIN